MARLTVEAATSGTAFELQSIADGRWGDIIQGGLDDVPDVRGTNRVHPEAAGQRPGAFNPHELPIRISQELWGAGATAALRRVSYRSRMTALKAQLGTPGGLIIIKVYPPNEGLSTGQVATITAQFERITGLPARGWESRSFIIEAVCIDSTQLAAGGWSIA